MKKVGKIMQEMGFNPKSSEGAQKAFIKYLVRVANKGQVAPTQEHPEQLSFDFEEKKKPQAG